MPLILNGDGSVGPLSATEVGFLDGVTSAVQTQIDSKYTVSNEWVSFTPTWQGLTVGNGTSTGAYFRIGKTVNFWARFTLGSTSAITGPLGVTTPTTLSGLNSASFMNCIVLDAGTTYYQMLCYYGGIFGTANVSGAAQNTSSTFPMTWAINDEIHVSGTYREA